MSLPNEIKSLIDNVLARQNLLLEWDLLENATRDTRIVLTWRQLDDKTNKPVAGEKTEKWKLKKSSFAVDKLHQNGLSVDDNSKNADATHQDKKIAEKTAENGTDKSRDTESPIPLENVTEHVSRRKTSAVERRGRARLQRSKSSIEFDASCNEDTKAKLRRTLTREESFSIRSRKSKSPFRKLKTGEKLSKKGKLQLSFSVDQDDVDLSEEDTELTVKEALHRIQGDKDNTDADKSTEKSKTSTSKSEKERTDICETSDKDKATKPQPSSPKDDQTEEKSKVDEKPQISQKLETKDQKGSDKSESKLLDTVATTSKIAKTLSNDRAKDTNKQAMVSTKCETNDSNVSNSQDISPEVQVKRDRDIEDQTSSMLQAKKSSAHNSKEETKESSGSKTVGDISVTNNDKGETKDTTDSCKPSEVDNNALSTSSDKPDKPEIILNDGNDGVTVEKGPDELEEDSLAKRISQIVLSRQGSFGKGHLRRRSKSRGRRGGDSDDSRDSSRRSSRVLDGTEVERGRQMTRKKSSSESKPSDDESKASDDNKEEARRRSRQAWKYENA